MSPKPKRENTSLMGWRPEVIPRGDQRRAAFRRSRWIGCGRVQQLAARKAPKEKIFLGGRCDWPQGQAHPCDLPSDGGLTGLSPVPPALARWGYLSERVAARGTNRPYGSILLSPVFALLFLTGQDEGAEAGAAALGAGDGARLDTKDEYFGQYV